MINIRQCFLFLLTGQKDYFKKEVIYQRVSNLELQVHLLTLLLGLPYYLQMDGLKCKVSTESHYFKLFVVFV